MTIELNSADALRRNWSAILAEGLLPQLIEEKVVELVFEAAINGHVVYRIYDGRADIRGVYRAFDEVIATASDFDSIVLTPELVHQVALTVIASEPKAVATLKRLNGGTMPTIRPPLVPEPQPEPEPTEPEPTD